MPKHPWLPNIPFVEAYHKGGKQRPTAIVIRSSNTTSQSGAALGRANMWHKRNSPQESFHYVVDETTVLRCVPDKSIAFHTRDGSKNAIGINVCAEPLESLEHWDDFTHAKLLQNTAYLVAELVIAYRIPVRYLDNRLKKRWLKHKWRSRGGIVVDIEGAWPLHSFMAEVQSRVSGLKSENERH